MKILLDMNLSPRWVEFLGREGIEARHWTEVGVPTASDSEILAWARSNEFAVFTHDLDFSSLLAATRSKGPSVILVRGADVLPDTIGADVVRVLKTRAAAIASGAIVTLDRRGARVRVLPIGPSHP